MTQGGWAVWDDEQGSTAPDRTSSPADTEAALRAYYARKRLVCVSALLSSVPVAAILVAATRAPILGAEFVLGVVCGCANALLLMRSGEGLAQRASLGTFTRSSVLRVLVFGAMPVVTAARSPWWVMGLYFAGLFTPLALYALAVRRESAAH